MLPRDPARSRPPTDRPLDIVGLELLLCVSQALLAGILLSLATDLGGDARAAGLPVPGLTAVLALIVGAAWLWWLVGGSGWPLAAVDFAVALLTGALWLLSLQDATAPHIDPLVGLVGVSCAIYGIVSGVFLPGPRRAHWKGGASQPRRGLAGDRTSPARFSPPVQKVVDERLTNRSLPRVARPAARRASVRPLVVAAPPVPAAAPKPAPATVATPAPAPTGATVAAPSPGAASTVPASTNEPGAPAVAAPPDVPKPPAGVHRIAVTEAEPLSVAAMRLAAEQTTTEGLARAEDDETLPFPVPGGDRPGTAGTPATPGTPGTPGTGEPGAAS